MNVVNQLVDRLPIGIEGENLITVLAGFAALSIFGAVWSSFLVHDPMAKRALKVLDHRRRLKSAIARPAGHTTRRKQSTANFMARVVKRFNLARSRHAEKIALRLARAGWRGQDAINTYLFAKLILPFGLGGAAALILFGTPVFAMPILAKTAIAASAIALGAYLPEVVIANQTQKRRQGLQRGLPDALDLLVICAEAGLGLEAALTRVAEEMAQAATEVADEFALTAVELGFLPDRAQALGNLDRRTELPAIRAVVNTLAQTEKYGTPLAQSLRVLSAEFRNDRMMKAEEKAAKLPATLTVPLVMFVLPSLFVVLLGPAVLRAIDGLGGL